MALAACLVGVGGGSLLQRAGWGGQAGTIFGFLSGVLAVFCAGALLLTWKSQRRS
jgi:hypothetical protein